MSDELKWDNIFAGGESPFEAGISNGLSLGFKDEAVGGILGFKDFASEYLKSGYPKEGLIENYKNYYIKNRDEQRASDHRLAGESPVGYAAGNILGSLAIPGSSVASAALAGGISGAGNSEAQTGLGVVDDAGVGAGAGAALSYLGQGAANLVNKYRQPVQLGLPVAQRVIGATPTEPIPLMQPKGELNIHDDVIQHEAANRSVQDRIAAFRKKRAAGEYYKNKSDDVAKEMFGMDPVEGGYNPKVDDITIPEGQRHLWGVGESDPPSIDPTDFDMMLMGEAPLPRQGNIPSELRVKEAPKQLFDNKGNPWVKPDSLPPSRPQLGGFNNPFPIQSNMTPVQLGSVYSTPSVSIQPQMSSGIQLGAMPASVSSVTDQDKE